MYLPKVIVLLALIISAPLPLFSVEEAPCTSPEYKQFDFWIGVWDVYDAKTNKLIGEESISYTNGGCSIQESWNADAGVRGTSLSFYNNITNEWSQIWVASNGYIIEMKGDFTVPDMITMTGTSWNSAKKEKNDFIGTWTKLNDHSLRQTLKSLNNKTQQWETWFDGIYMRKQHAMP